MASGRPKQAKAYTWYFEMRSTADGYTPQAGKSPSVTISIDGAGFAALTDAPTVTEIASGWYKVTVPAADMTAAVVILRATDTGALAEERIELDEITLSDLKIAGAFLSNKVGFDTASGVLTVYEADKTTPMAQRAAGVDGNEETLTPQ